MQPLVTVTSASGSTARPVPSVNQPAIAWRSAGMPAMGAYWLCPASIASRAARLTKSGPSKSGKPWPRLTARCWMARAVMGVKIVSPKPRRRSAVGSVVFAASLIMRPG